MTQGGQARSRMRLGALALSLLALGCNNHRDAGEATADRGSDAAVAPAPPLPSDAPAFLARLQPLPSDGPDRGIEIRYEVSGSMASGALTIQLAPGGYRRERWEIRWAGDDPDKPIVSEGSTITTPAQIWTGLDGEPGEIADNHLATLAAHFLALDEAQRRAVVESIDRWHATLAEQRLEHPGERATVAGVSCLQTRIAAQNLCLWEEAGVFLRYQGAAFSIVATSVDRQAKLAPALFEIPAAARAEATRVEVEAVDVDLILGALAAGSDEAMAGLLSPTIELAALAPPAVGDAGGTGDTGGDDGPTGVPADAPAPPVDPPAQTGDGETGPGQD